MVVSSDQRFRNTFQGEKKGRSTLLYDPVYGAGIIDYMDLVKTLLCCLQFGAFRFNFVPSEEDLIFASAGVPEAPVLNCKNCPRYS